MFWNIWLTVAILSGFVWAGKRAFERESSLLTFAEFIGEFLAFPVIAVYEEFTGRK